jgi:hypothetical protein
LKVSLKRKRFPERDPQKQLAIRVGEGRVGDLTPDPRYFRLEPVG